MQRNTKISFRSHTVYEISSQTFPFQTVPELGNYSSPFDREGSDGGTRGGPPASVMQRDAKRMEGEEEDHHVTWGNMVSEKDLKATYRVTKCVTKWCNVVFDLLWRFPPKRVSMMPQRPTFSELSKRDSRTPAFLQVGTCTVWPIIIGSV